DEPQHVKQGRTTLELLDCIGIAHELLPTDADQARELVVRATEYMRQKQSPFAIVVADGTFEKYGAVPESSDFEMRREDAVRGIAAKIGKSAVIVATTGKTARELFEYRAETGGDHARDFLTVGSMGHASQIAMSIAKTRNARQVICLDGDGALIMHMGSLAIIGTSGTQNFKHIVINNGAHDSVGGQPTAGHEINICEIARACCYRSAERIEKTGELDAAIDRLLNSEGPALLEIVTRTGARSDLGRPTISPIENKQSFMRNIEE
ncbi:MAG: phosphonopyruvate decarboxylase, partial [Woeseiaceae bacterium]